MVSSVLQLIKVKNIKDDVFVMDNNALRAVLAVPGINFSLLTDTEKEIVISQFKELLDGLDFPLQFLIVSRFANTENYINVLRVKLGDETEPLIRLQLEDYIKFIREYTETHKAMKKIFYVVVPYEPSVIQTGSFLSKKQTQKNEA